MMIPLQRLQTNSFVNILLPNTICTQGQHSSRLKLWWICRFSVTDLLTHFVMRKWFKTIERFKIPDFFPISIKLSFRWWQNIWTLLSARTILRLKKPIRKCETFILMAIISIHFLFHISELAFISSTYYCHCHWRLVHAKHKLHFFPRRKLNRRSHILLQKSVYSITYRRDSAHLNIIYNRYPLRLINYTYEAPSLYYTYEMRI